MGTQTFRKGAHHSVDSLCLATWLSSNVKIKSSPFNNQNLVYTTGNVNL